MIKTFFGKSLVLLLKKHSPRWFILLIDVTITLFSLLIAFWLRYNFSSFDRFIGEFFYALPWFAGVRILSFYFSKLYSGIIRHTSFKDIQRIFSVNLLSSLALIMFNFSNQNIFGSLLFPTSVVVIEMITTIYFMVTFRLLTKNIYTELTNRTKGSKNVLIYGSSELAQLAKKAVQFDRNNNYRVIGFIDTAKNVTAKKLEGLPVFHLRELSKVINNNKINALILAKEDIANQNREMVLDVCLNKNIEVLKSPSLKAWINGGVELHQLRNIKIEDLLERDPISITHEEIFDSIYDKTVLVTGAAGSIGSELVRQILKFSPEKILLVDQAESPLYDVELEMSERFNFYDFETIIADVTDKKRMEFIFSKYRPSMIFHAAAYKHVPMMEAHPYEASRNNIIGTKIIADLATYYEADKFIMVSTDKAVKPTNIMGASKRIAEMYVQSLGNKFKTRFITTRFGNVLGSNGSVIPRFKKQIESGGPVTVTHPQITRFFMTIPEACQLVLEASNMGQGGEIFVFDMGKSVKIADLAKKMIKLSGLRLGKDIQIKYTGLRPGEKLYEELLHDSENDMPTYHSKIMIAKVRKIDHVFIQAKLKNMEHHIKNRDTFSIVSLMKELVPDFVSKNSVYEALDVTEEEAKIAEEQK